MDRSLRFRRLLADRILLAAGLAVTAGAPLAASCGGKAVVEGDTGGAGAGGAGGAGPTSGITTGPSSQSSVSAVTTTTSGPSVVSASAVTSVNSVSSGPACGPGQFACFDWLVDSPCPGVGGALQYFPNDCGDSCYIFQVVDGPFPADLSCCYIVDSEFCGVGRPFLVGGAPRAAEATRGAGWGARGASPALVDLSPAARRALADAWTRDAVLEHASVAAFSRLSLDLLAVGAPADLVEDAHRAALDEVRHARLCFALASTYAGEPVQPGPFPFGGAVEVHADLVAIAVAAVIEGCVGETLAAVQAAEQLALAEDPAVRAALASIAEDEARHAELAWRTVAWAIRHGGETVRAAVEDSFRRAAAGLPGGADAELDGADRAALARHGRLEAATARTVLRKTLDEVVLPAAGALARAGRVAGRGREVASSAG